MMLPMFGLIFAVGVGSVLAGLVLLAVPRWQSRSVFVLPSLLPTVGAFGLSFVLGSVKRDFLGLLCGYILGGLGGEGLGSWLAVIFWRLLRQSDEQPYAVFNR